MTDIYTLSFSVFVWCIAWTTAGAKKQACIGTAFPFSFVLSTGVVLANKGDNGYCAGAKFYHDYAHYEGDVYVHDSCCCWSSSSVSCSSCASCTCPDSEPTCPGTCTHPPRAPPRSYFAKHNQRTPTDGKCRKRSAVNAEQIACSSAIFTARMLATGPRMCLRRCATLLTNQAALKVAKEGSVVSFGAKRRRRASLVTITLFVIVAVTIQTEGKLRARQAHPTIRLCGIALPPPQCLDMRRRRQRLQAIRHQHVHAWLEQRIVVLHE